MTDIDTVTSCPYCRVPLDQAPPTGEMAFVGADPPDVPTQPGQLVHHHCMTDMAHHLADEWFDAHTDRDWRFMSFDTKRQLLRDVLGRCVELYTE